MAQITDIQTDIEALSDEEFAHLREWFAEKDAERWNKRIAQDATSGKLEFLRKEAFAAKKEGTLQDW